MVFRNEEIKIKNKALKRRIVKVSYKLDLGHIGSCLTAVDIIDEIYKNKKLGEKFILSAGHAHLAHAVVMEKYSEDASNVFAGKNAEELIKLYGIHCDRDAGCDVSTGSLGQGLPIAVGMALADRSKNVYCLISDGECAEGSIWEALRIAYEHELTNLKIYANINGFGAYDSIDIYNGFTQHLADFNVENYYTSLDGYPDWLQGLQAHYIHLDEKKYKELMEVLQ